MKHEDFRLRYNEIMFDERDIIRDFLEKQADIRYGTQMWEWCLDNIEVIATNGAAYYCYEVFLEADEVWFRTRPVYDNESGSEIWDCSYFALGELSKIIDALPEVDDILLKNAEDDLKDFCSESSVNLEGEEFCWEVGCSKYEVQEIGINNTGELFCLVKHTDSLGVATMLNIAHFDLDIAQKLRDHVNAVILHRSKEYKELMSLLEKFENLRCTVSSSDYSIVPFGTDVVCTITSVYRDADKLYVMTSPEERIGDFYLFEENQLKSRYLSVILDAVKKMLPSIKYRITISELRSREVEVDAIDFSDAKEKALKILEDEPLNEEDSCGIEFC